MARRERLLDQDSADPLVRFALDLRKLRKQAGDPTYRMLAGQAGFSVTTLAEAAAGRRLPTLAVTRAYVRACGGDVGRWERRWHGLASARGATSADEARDADGRVDRTAPSPYVGLAAFDRGDADRFFGRAEPTAELFTMVTEQRFVAVFGASGSGKSSLLRAGLVARWAGNGGQFLVLVPGEHPLETYLAARAALPDPDREAAESSGAGGLLVVVDQFEEVFTVCTDERERTRFIALLLETAHRADSHVRVVLGVRTDFYSHCAHEPALAHELRHGQYLVGPMTTEQLRAAITQPALRAGAMVETALVTQIVADCTGQRGVLPLLSHALRETWQRRSGATLTLAGYQAVGGIVHAIAQTAELVYTGLDQHEQRLAKALFLRLVALGEGTEDTKRRITTAELGMTDQRTVAMLARLTGARLITVDHDQLELTHEALIRHWPRLGEWLAEDRDGLWVHRQLTLATAGWQSLRQDPAALYRGAQLTLARQWAHGREDLLSGQEREFLACSTRAEDQIRALARQRTRRLRALVALLSVLVVVAGSLAVVAATSRQAAVAAAQALTRQRDQVAALDLLDRAADQARSDPELAAQLSVAAYRLYPDQRTRSGVLNYAADINAWGTRTPGSLLALSPDGRLLAVDSGTAIQLLTLSDMHMVHAVGSIPHPATGWPQDAEFSPDGSRLIVNFYSSRAEPHTELWNTSNPARPALLSAGFDTGFAGFGSDRYLLVNGVNNTVWDLADPRHPRRLAAIQEPVASEATVSRDGRTLVELTGENVNRLRLWNIADRRKPRLAWQTVLPGDPGRSSFALRGSLLAVATGTGTVQLWNIAHVDAPSYVGALQTQSTLYNGIALSPDGTELAAALPDSVRVWDLSTPASPHLIASLADHTPDPPRMLAFASDSTLIGSDSPSVTGTAINDTVTTVSWWRLPEPGLSGRTVNGAITPAFSPDGRVMATVEAPTQNKGWTQLWNVSQPDSPTAVRTIAGTGVGQAAVFASHGHLLATTSGQGMLWDDSNLQRPRPLATVPDTPLRFNPNGRMLAGTVGVWDVSHPTRPHMLLKFPNSQIDGLVAFSPHSDLLAVAGSDRTGSSIILWNLRAPHRPTVVGHLAVPATQLAFLPGSHILATITLPGQVRLWDIADPARPRAVAALAGLPDRNQQLVVSPNGKTLAIAGADSTTQLWNVTDPDRPTLLATLTDATPEAFDATAGILAVQGTDGSIQLRDVDTTHVITRICQSAPSLDPAARHRYAPNVLYPHPCPTRHGRS